LAWDLDDLERSSVSFLLRVGDHPNGLVADSDRAGAPCSVSATGFGLAACVIAADRGWIERSEAIDRVGRTLRFLRDSPQGETGEVAGFKGFYYHFLDIERGVRTWDCELSMVDTAFLIAGALTCGAYFTGSDAHETEIREIARTLYERVDWPWATNGRPVLSMAWKPNSGFSRYDWTGYSEALLLYLLGLGSPTHPLPAESWGALCAAYQWENLYDIDLLFGAPLFVHQLTHAWIDLRGLRDPFMRQKDLDYFENSRRAVRVQREYARLNPLSFKGYHDDCWGFTAGLGPGPQVRIDEAGIERHYYAYVARGAPFGPDDGTLAPWAVAACAPFAPEAVERALRRFCEDWPQSRGADGLLTSFNPHADWVATEHLGIDQGPVALLLENQRSGLVWRLLGSSPAIARGLRRADFQAAR
jgi:hypothetical protein